MVRARYMARAESRSEPRSQKLLVSDREKATSAATAGADADAAVGPGLKP